MFALPFTKAAREKKRRKVLVGVDEFTRGLEDYLLLFLLARGFRKGQGKHVMVPFA